LLNVYFDFDKSALKKESDEALEAILSLMKGFPNMEIELRGHTDNLNGTKDPEYNVKLSQKRADAVKASLVKKGIKENRIKSKGFGETVPVADNATDEGRAMNRRTEFVVLKK
jgi:outer membrane protein OmpA-like peptidoglycan-associated protein